STAVALGLSAQPLLAADDANSSAEIENTAVVESGTYKGTAHRVDPKEKEVYFKMEDERILELYFQNDTKLTRKGEAAEFSELKGGRVLEVKVQKTGGKLGPLEVQLLEGEGGR